MPDYPGVSEIVSKIRWFVSGPMVWSPAYRRRKIEDYRAFTVAMLLALGPVAAALWMWDFLVDPANAPKTIPLRVLTLSIGIAAAALYSRLQRIAALRVVAFGSLLAAELIYSYILTIVHADSYYAESAYLFFAFGALLVTEGFPAWEAMAVTVALGIVPQLLGLVGFIPGFDQAHYAVVIWPGILMACAAILANGFTYAQLYAARTELELLSAIDPLTSVPNRRQFEAVLQQEIARSRRFGHTLALLMLDLDEFKRVNDEHGHATGDLVLATFAETCRATLRQTDTFARLGGDEFVAILPETDLDGAVLLAETIRAAAECHPTVEADGRAVPCTVSIGVAVGDAKSLSSESLIAQADAMLYEAKQAGRNRVRTSAAHVAQPREVRA